MPHPTLVVMTSQLHSTQLLTLGLCVILGSFACYCSGYVSAHAANRQTYTIDQHRQWIACFLFIGITGFLYGALILLGAPTHDIRHDYLIRTITILICLLMELTMTLILDGEIRVRAATSSQQRSGNFLMWLPWIAFTSMALIAIQQGYGNSDPQQAFHGSIVYEILTLCLLLTTFYGASALIRREGTALILFPGLLLFLLAPLVAGLSSVSPNFPFSPASWFLLFHLGGLIFVFLATQSPDGIASRTSIDTWNVGTSRERMWHRW